MSGFDSPGFGIEVVCARADVLDTSEGMAHETDLDDATRGVRRQDQGFATQVGNGLSIADLNVEC